MDDFIARLAQMLAEARQYQSQMMSINKAKTQQGANSQGQNTQGATPGLDLSGGLGILGAYDLLAGNKSGSTKSSMLSGIGNLFKGLLGG